MVSKLFKRDGNVLRGGDTDLSEMLRIHLTAKLAISIARKLGSLIFLTPEDIVELRGKLIMTFVGR